MMTPSRLAALDFSRDIDQLTQDFTGREWLFAAIDHWLHHTNQRFFILTGEPGIGKSAIAARLIQTREDILAYHFCLAWRNNTIVPGTIFRSLAAQLGQRLPGYGQALANTVRAAVQVDIEVATMTGGEITGVVINHLHAGNPQEELVLLLGDPLVRLAAPPRPTFILIDSLDEALTYRGEDNLVTLLTGLADLPPWVRFLCTSRPERPVLRYFEPLQPYLLAAESAPNQADIERYISQRLAQETMQDRLWQANITPSMLADQVAGLAEGNFLYTKILLNDIEAGQQSLANLAARPKSLDDISHAFLRCFSLADWEERYRPLLGVLAEAQEPLTETHLAHFTGLNRREVRQNLGVAQQFLTSGETSSGEKRYSLFHQSLRDYLLDAARNEDFWCDPVEEHHKIANYYLKHYQTHWFDCDHYGLRHLPFHLSWASQDDILRQLLLQFDWLQAKLNATDITTLLTDFDLPLSFQERGPGGEVLRDALRLSAHVLAQDKSQLAGQLWGRLLSFDQAEIQVLLEQARPGQSVPWLRPLTPSLTQPGGPLRRTLTGHTDEVTAVAVTPDGRYAVSGSLDKTLKVWDLTTGQAVRTLTGHASYVTAVTVTPDGRYSVSGSADNALKVWELATGQAVRTLNGYPWWVLFHSGILAVAVTPDGRYAISGSDDTTLKVWDLEQSVEVHTLSGHKGKVNAVAVRPDGRFAVSGSWDKTLTVWDLATGQALHTLTSHTDWVRTVAVTPDGRYAVSGSEDQTLKVWDLATGQALHTLTGHTGKVTAVVVTPDGRYAISGSEDQTLKVWDLTTGKVIAGFSGDGAINTCAVAPAGVTLVVGEASGRVHFLRLENFTPGPPVVTAWRSARPTSPSQPWWRFWRWSAPSAQPPAHAVQLIAIGCPRCRTWSELPASVLGTELPCPQCGQSIRLNPFTFEADWRPVAQAWVGKPR